jgi:assimilatory nitrate reductase catalytic subunit
MAFRTADQKAKLLPLEWYPMEENLSEAFPVMLNTGRTVEQWHTRTKTRSIDIINNLAPEAWVEINPVDAEQLEVKSGDRLTLSSPRGKVKDVVVKVTQNMAPGQVFVPFHFNEQLINQLTQPLFCPKSGEPNYKQTAVQLHSEKVPQGIKVKEQDIAGELSHEKVTEKSRKVEVKEKSV